jgi:hypothetical protein
VGTDGREMVLTEFSDPTSRQNATSHTFCLERELELANLVAQLLDVR